MCYIYVGFRLYLPFIGRYRWVDTVMTKLFLLSCLNMLHIDLICHLPYLPTSVSIVSVTQYQHLDNGQMYIHISMHIYMYIMMCVCV